jgi:hypothetical protein
VRHERVLLLVVPRLAARRAGHVRVARREVLAGHVLVGVGRDVVGVLPVAGLGVLDDGGERVGVRERPLVGSPAERDEVGAEVAEAVV